MVQFMQCIRNANGVFRVLKLLIQMRVGLKTSTESEQFYNMVNRKMMSDVDIAFQLTHSKCTGVVRKAIECENENM